ncbi:MAG: hypothetical protein IJL06_05595 [Kiritimatiellae bacterium]|nr:hypothetical protein [Kiritimatiellia bacterium]
MSKPVLAVLAAAAVLAATHASASPAVPDDGRLVNYAIPADVLTDFHGGLQGFLGDRNVKDDFGFKSEMDVKRLNAYLGYDIGRWLSIYVLGGVLSVENDKAGIDEETTFLYGAGLWAALIDDAQLDFLSTISRYRLNFGMEVSHSDPNDLSWTEFDASLTFGIYNDSFLSDGKFPTAIGIFAGPIYTTIDMDGYKQVKDNNWGLTVGGELRFANGVYASGGVDIYTDDNVGYFQLGVRF